jgi:hypothetical protein
MGGVSPRELVAGIVLAVDRRSCPVRARLTIARPMSRPAVGVAIVGMIEIPGLALAIGRPQRTQHTPPCSTSRARARRRRWWTAPYFAGAARDRTRARPRSRQTVEQ